MVSKDTIVRRDFTMFGPTNLFIPMFDEEKTQLYLVDEARKNESDWILLSVFRLNTS